MYKEQWDGAFQCAPLMYIVDVQGPEPFHFDVSGEHWKLIEFVFMRTPVVAVFPFVDQTFHIRERDAAIPANVA